MCIDKNAIGMVRRNAIPGMDTLPVLRCCLETRLPDVQCGGMYRLMSAQASATKALKANGLGASCNLVRHGINVRIAFFRNTQINFIFCQILQFLVVDNDESSIRDIANLPNQRKRRPAGRRFEQCFSGIADFSFAWSTCSDYPPHRCRKPLPCRRCCRRR